MQSTHLREHNLSTVLTAVASATGPISRANVAAATRLTKPTVSKLVEELIESRLIQEGSPLATGMGRPMIPLQPASRTLLAIGLEVTADRLTCRGIDLLGDEVGSWEVPLEASTASLDRIVAACLEAIDGVRAGVQGVPVVGVVLAIPGRNSPDDSRVISAPNLGWTDVPLVGRLRAEPSLAGIAIRAQNDNRLSVVTEIDQRPGASFLYLRGSTGVGGAIVLEGTLLDGVHGWAGEFGHTVVEPDGALCRCGRRGCLEAYVSAYALARHAAPGRAGGVEDLIELGARGSSREEVIRGIGRPLGLAITNALNVLDLSTVVLSGYLAPIAEELQPVIHETVAHHALAAEIGPVTIERSDELDAPALHGAARAALQPVFDTPRQWRGR